MLSIEEEEEEEEDEEEEEEEESSPWRKPPRRASSKGMSQRSISWLSNRCPPSLTGQGDVALPMPSKKDGGGAGTIPDSQSGSTLSRGCPVQQPRSALGLHAAIFALGAKARLRVGGLCVGGGRPNGR